jgi:hypothetical protein
MKKIALLGMLLVSLNGCLVSFYRTHTYPDLSHRQIQQITDPARIVIIDLGDSAYLAEQVTIEQGMLSATLLRTTTGDTSLPMPSLRKGVHYIEPPKRKKIHAIVYVSCFWQKAPADRKLRIPVRDIIEVHSFTAATLANAGGNLIAYLVSLLVIAYFVLKFLAVTGLL